MSRGALCCASMETFFLIGLALRAKVAANVLAECVNLTEIMVLKQEIRDFSYGTSSLEAKFNISMNSGRSEGIKQDLVFHTMNFVFENLMCKVKHFFPG